MKNPKQSRQESQGIAKQIRKILSKAPSQLQTNLFDNSLRRPKVLIENPPSKTSKNPKESPRILTKTDYNA